MNISYLHNMKFIQFIESIIPQVIKMKKLFTLCLHVTLQTDPTWLMKGPWYCHLPEIRISKNKLCLYTFNIQFMYENVNYSFLPWKIISIFCNLSFARQFI